MARLVVLGCLVFAVVAPTVARAEVREFPLPPGASPREITVGPDGALWFTESGQQDGRTGADIVPGRIGRIGLDGSISEFPLGAGRHPVGIAVGGDGNVWFTAPSSHSIGRMTLGGTVTFFSLLPSLSWPMQIARGPDGALWYPGWLGGGKIGRVALDGTITEYPVSGGLDPFVVIAGGDGALWFGANNPCTIGRITTTGAVTTQFPFGWYSGPDSATLAADSTVWMGDLNYPLMYRVPSDGSPPTRLTLPGRVQAMAADADGAIWLSLASVAVVGRWTPIAPIAEYPLPSGGKPFGITLGPDHAVWFTIREPDGVGRIEIPDIRPPQTQALAASGKRGRSVVLRYRSWDDRGSTRDRLTILRGDTKLWTKATPLAESSAATVKSVTWKIPARISGSLRFCVQAWDTAANASTVSCARLRVT